MRRDVLGRKKLHLDIIPIDFATLFPTCDISDFQFRFSSKITLRKCSGKTMRESCGILFADAKKVLLNITLSQ